MWSLDRNGDRYVTPSTEVVSWGSPGDLPVVGDWDGDGYDEVGVFSAGTWFIDLNGDGVFDPATEIKGWGMSGWKPMPGDWNGDGVTDLGVVSPDSVWFRDLNGDFAFDPATEIVGWGSPGDTPVVADWNGDGADEIAVYSGGVWFIDYNGDGAFDPATEIKGWGVAGWTPLPGDWDGDGKTDLGVVSPDSVWFRDLNGDFTFDPATEAGGWGSPGDAPLAADWNGDGRADLGVYSGGVWFVDLNGDGSWQAASEAIVGIGQAGHTPVVGRWGQAASGAVGFYPEPGSQGIPYSTRVIVSLADAVNPATVDGGSVQLLENGVGIAASRVVSADGRSISVRGTLKATTDYAVIVSGLRTLDDRAIPDASSAFRTGSASSTAPHFYAFPGILDDLPPELPIRFAMTVPIDPVSLTSESFVLENLASGAKTPLSCSVDAGFLEVICSTGSTLAVGTRFRVVSQDVTSVHGQRLNENVREFTTGFEPDDGKAPRVLRITPIDGAMELHPYTQVEIDFDERIEVQAPAPRIRMTRNGVPIEVSFGHRFEQQNILSVSPVQGFPYTEGATYVLTVDEAYDISGRGLANPGASSTFTIRSGGDGPENPRVTIQPSGGELPLNAVFFAEMNQPPQPQTVNADTVRILGPDGELVPVELTLQSPTMLRIVPQAQLAPNTTYLLTIGDGMLDSFGQLFSGSTYFVTGDALDQTGPQVLSVSPPDGAQNVVPPHQVRLLFSERVVGPERGFRLERANGDLVAWRESGFTTLQLLEDGQLDPGQQYRIVVEGATDLAGNPLPPFQSTFTTAPTGAASDTTRPTIVASDPASEAVDVSLTPTITIELSEPLDPTSVQSVSLATTLAEPIDVTLLGDGRTLQIVPLQPLKPGRLYHVAVNATDWAGNRCAPCGVRFTTAAGAPDNTPPHILSITPADGSVVDAPYLGVADLTVVFSEPVEPSTLNSNVFVAIDGKRVSVSPRLMGDGATAVIPVFTRLPGSSFGIA